MASRVFSRPRRVAFRLSKVPQFRAKVASTRISALEFQWVSRCRNQLQKWARYSMPRRGSRCFSFGRNFARESRFQAMRTASACTFSWPKGRLPHFSAKFRRKCFLAFSVASGRNLPGGSATHPSLRGALATKQSRGHSMWGGSNPDGRIAAPGLLRFARNDGQGIGSLVSACRLSSRFLLQAKS
jgi:hypothetical protein